MGCPLNVSPTEIIIINLFNTSHNYPNPTILNKFAPRGSIGSCISCFAQDDMLNTTMKISLADLTTILAFRD